MTTGQNRRATSSRNLARLLGMSQGEREALFARGKAEPMPGGEYRGILILPLRPTFLRHTAALIGGLAWRGKRFDVRARRVTNLVLPFGLPAVTAEVRKGPSRLDGRACIILDYARTSLAARGIQDELRLVRPGLYLGRAYWRGIRILDFALARGGARAKPASGSR